MDLPLIWITVIIFGSVVILLASGMWVGLAIGAAGLASIICILEMPDLIGDIMWNTLSSYILAAIPFFVFMGDIVLRSGLAERLYTGVTKWTKVIPGGLVHSNIASCAIFAAITGSSVATVATMGGVAYPEQEARGYNKGLVAGSLTAGGTLGPMIPPSISMIVYGAFCEVSVARLFIGTAIPGILMAIIFMIYILIRNVHDSSLAPRREPVTMSYFRGAISAWIDIWPIFLLMAIIFVGIYGGFMTPTEAACVSGFVAVCLAAAFRKLTVNMVREASLKALKVTAMILLIIVSAHTIGYALAMLMIPKQLCNMVAASGWPPLGIWAVLVIMYCFLGCFLEFMAMFFLTIGVVFPLMMNLGFDPIWLGVALGITLETSLLTPPVGLNLYVCQSVTKLPFIEVVRGSFPFFLCMLVMITLLSFFPQLATWLPGTMARW